MKSRGFTLIELLVVITLIGVLAVAVLSALNPIEQINKARDAGKRADASQLLTALDRYFASNEKFPWNNYTGYNTSVDVAFGGTADMVGVGVCGNGVTTDALAVNSTTAGCADDGYLINTQELKEQFGKRPYFRSSTLATDRLQVYKAVNEPSVSVCFIPSSKATRDKAGGPNSSLKDLTFTGGRVSGIGICSTAPSDWTTVDSACFVCIPEE
jgi:prepilin-type N-terminal cleavage/methylation domain-containing protein